MQSPCFPQPHSKWLGDQCDYKLSTPIATCHLRGRIIGNFRTRYLGFINGVCCNAVKNLWQEMCEERCQRIGMCIILDTLSLSHHHIPGNWSNFSSTFSKRKIKRKCERQRRFLMGFCLQGSLMRITRQIRNHIFKSTKELPLWIFEWPLRIWRPLIPSEMMQGFRYESNIADISQNRWRCTF